MAANIAAEPSQASSFVAALRARWGGARTLLCVGLDPDPAKFPRHLQGPTAILDFCSAIVDATHDLVCAFKPQIAYFAANRAEDQLEALIAYIHERHPGLPVILDAKRATWDRRRTSMRGRCSSAIGRTP